MLHALQQAAEDENVTVVVTPEGLQAALHSQARHSEIRSHLDLTNLEPYGPLFDQMMLCRRASTWSIWVRPPCACYTVSSATSFIAGRAHKSCKASLKTIGTER
jgi:hypothetical protein